MLSRHLSKGFFIEISWKCSCMKIKTLLHKWFQPIVYCVLPDVIIFLAISGTEYWKAINLCQHLVILITWQVFGNLNLLETNVTMFYFQFLSKEINSANWFFYQIWWTDHLCVYLVTQRVTYSVQNIRGVPNRSVKKS